MKKITTYQCDYCRTRRKTIEGMLSHEKDCDYNPKNKSCKTCLIYSSFDGRCLRLIYSPSNNKGDCKGYTDWRKNDNKNTKN